jgi:hypothetical protein
MTKICVNCTKDLPIGEFYKRKNTSDGLMTSCKSCVKERLSDKEYNTPEEKICSKCKVTKFIIEFSKNAYKQDGHNSSCKQCASEYYKQRIINDPDFKSKNAASAREGWTKRHLKIYNLDKETFEKLISLGCAICGGPPNGRGRYAMDHDHDTGKFRGLLCSRCNAGLGYFLDNVEVLEKALNYLRKHKEEQKPAGLFNTWPK